MRQRDQMPASRDHELRPRVTEGKRLVLIAVDLSGRNGIKP